jgi:hypothetical protein
MLAIVYEGKITSDPPGRRAELASEDVAEETSA